MPKRAKVSEPQRVGWSVKRFCDEADISDALFYKLDPDQRPASVKVGGKRIVTESPAAWLARMGAQAAADCWVAKGVAKPKK